MKRIAIIPNTNKDAELLVTDSVVVKLLELGFDVFVHSDILYDKDGVTAYDEFPDGIDLIIIVGGDGSVIDASHLAIDRDIPLIGVNLGKVGYLTELEVEALSKLDRLATGEYSIAEKMLLTVDFDSKDKRCERYAVNDVVISRDAILNIADIKIEDSMGNTVKFRADGVILSTPQGSTAYSFSTGGPIIAHNVESILLTPVSPHSLFNRSVIFNSHDVIKATNSGESILGVSIDGRCVGQLLPGEACSIRKSAKVIKMLTFTENSMFSSLFKKMRILGEIN